MAFGGLFFLFPQPKSFPVPFPFALPFLFDMALRLGPCSIPFSSSFTSGDSVSKTLVVVTNLRGAVVEVSTVRVSSATALSVL